MSEVETVADGALGQAVQGARAAGAGQTGRERLVLPGLVVLAMVTGVIGSLGAPIIPEIARTEHVSVHTAQWAITAGMLVSAVSTPIIGRLGAGGRRKTVMVGVLALVCLGALLAALPLGIELLIAGRAVQGIGLGLSPLVFAVARDALPPSRHRAAIAAISVAGVVAAGLGFPVTAVTAEVAGVKGAFWLGLGLTLFALVVAVVAVPSSRGEAPGEVDWIGAVLLGLGIFGLLLAISQAARWGYLAAPTVSVLAAGLVLTGLCVGWLRRTAHPLVDLRLASHPGVAATHVAALLAGGSMYLDFALVMLLLQTPHGLGYGLDHSVALAGSMMLPYAVASVVGNRCALRFGPLIGPDLLLPLGCAVFGLANLLLLVAPASLVMVIAMMTIAGLGSGLTFNSIPWLMLGFVPAAETGSAMSFNMVMRFLGFSLGSALALAAEQGYADDRGHPTRLGYQVGGAWGVGVAVLAVLCCAGLGRVAARRQGPTSPN